ncbi:hypothetical protein ACLGI4_28650 [Streptomyces sp. HMX112]
MSGWNIAAIIAGGWLWGQAVGFGPATESPAPSPDPSESQPPPR